jgi:DUF1365 family protein
VVIPPAGSRSCVYEGHVAHRRPGPGGHGFTQPVRLALIDLDEVDALCRRHPLWSARHPAPAWFRRADYLGDPAVPLATATLDLVEAETGERPGGGVSVLTHVRTWGWSFNPISCYFCYDGSGEVQAMVAEVTNTPWHERHCYVVGPPGVHEMAKALHVSPFLGMDLTYRLTYTAPGERLAVDFAVTGPEGPVLHAGVRLARRPADRRSLGQMVWAPHRGTVGVSAGIYRQAAALRRKGIRFHPHPRRAAPGPPGAVGSGPDQGGQRVTEVSAVVERAGGAGG